MDNDSPPPKTLCLEGGGNCVIDVDPCPMRVERANGMAERCMAGADAAAARWLLSDRHQTLRISAGSARSGAADRLEEHLLRLGGRRQSRLLPERPAAGGEDARGLRRVAPGCQGAHQPAIARLA